MSSRGKRGPKVCPDCNTTFHRGTEFYYHQCGPCKYCGADSILKASIRISWVALKKARIVMNKAVKNRLSLGSVNAVNINTIIIKNWENKSQLLLWPNFLSIGNL